MIADAGVLTASLSSFIPSTYVSSLHVLLPTTYLLFMSGSKRSLPRILPRSHAFHTSIVVDVALESLESAIRT